MTIYELNNAGIMIQDICRRFDRCSECPLKVHNIRTCDIDIEISDDQLAALPDHIANIIRKESENESEEDI